jgi:hypothetical protein
MDGQKKNPFKVQTLLLFSMNVRTNADREKEKAYYMSTFLKDRGREFVDKVELWDFAYQYLGEVAGWEM